MNADFAIVLLVLILVVIAMFIYSIILMDKTLKKYGELNEHYTNRQLEKIELAAEETVESLRGHANELNKKIRSDYFQHASDLKKATSNIENSYKKTDEDFKKNVLEISKSYQALNQALTKSIQSFIDDSKKALSQQITDLNVTNKTLDVEVQKMKEFLVEGREIRKNTEGVFNKIEHVSDKSKELISEHLIRLDNFDKSFESDLKTMKTKYDAVVKQKNAGYEVLFAGLEQSFKSTLENLVIELNKKLDLVSSNGIAEIENVGQKNKQFISEVIQLNKLPEIIEKNHEIALIVKNLVADNEENMKTLINITNERYLELENKLNNKKRGLFG